VDYGTDLDPALLELCRDRLGLNEPLHIQFLHFMRGVLSFDFGVSMWTGRPIIEELDLRFALSLQLAVMATVVTLLIAVPLGIIAALRQNTWIDYLVRAVAIAGVAMPSFWLGILIILGFLILSQAWFGEPWMPPIYYVSPFKDFWGNMSQLIWPALVVGYRYAAVVARMTRSALLEVLREDYIRTAQAKGLPEKIILNRHALRNSFLPVITLIGIEFSFFMGGLVVTEQVFNLNGLGRLLVDSVLYADYNMIQALVMIVVAVSVLVNLFVDLSYAWLDPRIRYS
jgi:peptide/nickel transport system permease protein